MLKLQAVEIQNNSLTQDPRIRLLRHVASSQMFLYAAAAIIYCNLQIVKQLQHCKKRFTSSWVHAQLEDSPLLNVMWLRIAYFDTG